MQVFVDVLHTFRQLDLGQLETELDHLGAVLVASFVSVEEGHDVTVSQHTPQPRQLGLRQRANGSQHRARPTGIHQRQAVILPLY